MANLLKVSAFGNSTTIKNNVASLILANIPSARLTGSAFFAGKNYETDYDIFISTKEGGLFYPRKELYNTLKLIENQYSFDLFRHTSDSSYKKPWITNIYRLVFSNRLNDHIDIIIVAENHYAQFSAINEMIFLHHREKYDILNKASRNEVINLAMQTAIQYGIQKAIDLLGWAIFVEGLNR